MNNASPVRWRPTRVRQFAGVGVLVMVLAGCGTTPGKPAPTETVAATALTVVVTAAEGVPPVTYSLECAGGVPSDEQSPDASLPDPAAACETVQNHADLLATEPDPATACTQVYGGPETAVVTGIVEGTEVNASFSRRNGCEIDRWAMFEALLGTPGGGAL